MTPSTIDPREEERKAAEAPAATEEELSAERIEESTERRTVRPAPEPEEADTEPDSGTVAPEPTEAPEEPEKRNEDED